VQDGVTQHHCVGKAAIRQIPGSDHRGYQQTSCLWRLSFRRAALAKKGGSRGIANARNAMQLPVCRQRMLAAGPEFTADARLSLAPGLLCFVRAYVGFSCSRPLPISWCGLSSSMAWTGRVLRRRACCKVVPQCRKRNIAFSTRPRRHNKCSRGNALCRFDQ
jgi:hypothetical protein